MSRDFLLFYSPIGHLESSWVTMSTPLKRLSLNSCMESEEGNRPEMPEMTTSGSCPFRDDMTPDQVWWEQFGLNTETDDGYSSSSRKEKLTNQLSLNRKVEQMIEVVVVEVKSVCFMSRKSARCVKKKLITQEVTAFLSSTSEKEVLRWRKEVLPVIVKEKLIGKGIRVLILWKKESMWSHERIGWSFRLEVAWLPTILDIMSYFEESSINNEEKNDTRRVRESVYCEKSVYKRLFGWWCWWSFYDDDHHDAQVFFLILKSLLDHERVKVRE